VRLPGQYLITFNGAGTAVLGTRGCIQMGPILVKSGKLLCNGGASFFARRDQRGGRGAGAESETSPVRSRSAMAAELRTPSLSPGDGIGTLHTAAVTLGNDAEFKFELNSTAGMYDLLSANGTVQLGSAILSISDLGSTTLPLGFSIRPHRKHEQQRHDWNVSGSVRRRHFSGGREFGGGGLRCGAQRRWRGQRRGAQGRPRAGRRRLARRGALIAGLARRRIRRME